MSDLKSEYELINKYQKNQTHTYCKSSSKYLKKYNV